MIETNTPDPDALENIFDNATSDSAASASADRRAILQAENEIAKKYWGSFQPRIVLTQACRYPLAPKIVPQTVLNAA